MMTSVALIDRLDPERMAFANAYAENSPAAAEAAVRLAEKAAKIGLRDYSRHTFLVAADLFARRGSRREARDYLDVLGRPRSTEEALLISRAAEHARLFDLSSHVMKGCLQRIGFPFRDATLATARLLARSAESSRIEAVRRCAPGFVATLPDAEALAVRLEPSRLKSLLFDERRMYEAICSRKTEPRTLRVKRSAARNSSAVPRRGGRHLTPLTYEWFLAMRVVLRIACLRHANEAFCRADEVRVRHVLQAAPWNPVTLAMALDRANLLTGDTHEVIRRANLYSRD